MWTWVHVCKHTLSWCHLLIYSRFACRWERPHLSLTHTQAVMCQCLGAECDEVSKCFALPAKYLSLSRSLFSVLSPPSRPPWSPSPLPTNIPLLHQAVLFGCSLYLLTMKIISSKLEISTKNHSSAAFLFSLWMHKSRSCGKLAWFIYQLNQHRVKLLSRKGDMKQQTLVKPGYTQTEKVLYIYYIHTLRSVHLKVV